MQSKKDLRKLKGIPRKSSRRKLGMRFDKYAAYRRRVGKPNGPGVAGNKSGRNASVKEVC